MAKHMCAIDQSVRRLQQLLVRRRPQMALACPAPRNKRPDLRYEFGRDFHNRVGRRLVRSFIFRYRLFRRLAFIVLQHSPDPFLVPAIGKARLCHRFFLRRRRSARKGFGPRSNAVITKTESGSRSGT